MRPRMISVTLAESAVVGPYDCHKRPPTMPASKEPKPIEAFK